MLYCCGIDPLMWNRLTLLGDLGILDFEFKFQFVLVKSYHSYMHLTGYGIPRFLDS